MVHQHKKIASYNLEKNWNIRKVLDRQSVATERLFLACLEVDSNGGGAYNDYYRSFLCSYWIALYVKSPHELPDFKLNIVQVGILFYLKLL